MLTLGQKKDIRQILRKHETPFYVYWEKQILDKIQCLKRAFLPKIPRSIFCYSMKSCFCPAIVQIPLNEGLWLDCSSGGEIAFALRAGASPDRIIYTSIVKQEPELAFAITKGIDILSIDSFSDMEKIYRVAKSLETLTGVLIRVNPAVDSDPRVESGVITTGHQRSKFGVSLWQNEGQCDSAEHLVREILSARADHLKLKGFHFHLGSNLLDVSLHGKAVQVVLNFCQRLRNLGLGFEMRYLDIGGGFPPEETMPISTWATVIEKALRETTQPPDFDLIVEPGRYLVYQGVLVSTVSNIKFNPYAGTIAVLDTGYHHLLDSILAGQTYRVSCLKQDERGGQAEYHLVGRLCDSLDEFTNLTTKGRHREQPLNTTRVGLPMLREGDRIIFEQCGAYSTVLNTHFNAFPSPAIFLVREDGAIDMVRQRTSEEDLYLSEGGDFL